MHAAVLAATNVNPYHPATNSGAPLDVLLTTIGVIILLLVVIVPATRARNKEHRDLNAGPAAADDA